VEVARGVAERGRGASQRGTGGAKRGGEPTNAPRESPPVQLKPDTWTPLFNGKDFSGWEKWLTGVGADNDPGGVFTVAAEDGAPAVRISGTRNGSLATRAEYADYHLRLQFKWAPGTTDGNSGVIYHGFGPGKLNEWFLPGAEYGVNVGPKWTPGGTFWTPGNPVGDVELDNGVYKRGAPKRAIAGVTASSSGALQKADDWNTVEILTVGGTAIHLLNGKVVLVVTNLRRKTATGEAPLRSGRIQLESGLGTIFYRNIEIRPIKAVPPEYLGGADRR
jgi:hypothetical protein